MAAKTEHAEPAQRGPRPVWAGLRQAGALCKEAVTAWREDRASSMGAALAYYTAFSVAPLLIISIAVASLFYGRDPVQGAIINQLGVLLGESGGKAIDEILRSTGSYGGGASGSGIISLVIGVGALVLGATTAFVELQDDLDRIWKAEPRLGNGIINLIRSRLLSFGMVMFIGLLLTVSMVLNAAIATIGKRLFTEVEVLLHLATFAVTFSVTTVLFAIIYKVLPNVRTAWADVWLGAAVTALLFEIGKFLIGLYIGKSSVASSFGSAGPFVVLMVWIYYSTQIFLLGAEFTAAHARRNVKGAAGVPGAAHTVHTGQPSHSETRDLAAQR